MAVIKVAPNMGDQDEYEAFLTSAISTIARELLSAFGVPELIDIGLSDRTLLDKVHQYARDSEPRVAIAGKLQHLLPPAFAYVDFLLAPNSNSIKKNTKIRTKMCRQMYKGMKDAGYLIEF